MASKCSTCEVSLPNIQKRSIYFERKISYSGKSLVISIPEDLIRYMGVTRDKKVRIIPVSRKQFLVEVL